MMRILKWIALLLGGLLLALGAAALVFGVFRFGWMPMMVRGFRGPLPFGRFGIFGMWALILARLFIPLVLIAILVLIGVIIGRGWGRTQTQAVRLTCPTCGRPIQAEWNHCPNCGTTLKNNEPRVSQEENDLNHV